MCFELILGWPSGSIDSLKLLIGFVASPVSGRQTSKGVAISNHARIWKVWTSAKILPNNFARLRVYVVVNG